tara:strand:- start:69 stop:281 length:213 start_codon:yes stop_codon:yes gene_type:complete
MQGRLKTAELTEIQQQILSMLAEGYDSSAIHGLLGISAATVQYHRNSIIDKMGASTMLQAAVIASKRGLV